MNVRSTARGLLVAAAVLLLLALSWWMASGAVQNLSHARTIGQKLETAVQFACALLCVATAVTRFRWQRWSRAARLAWAASLAGMAGLSALVWGPPQVHIALLFAAVALLLAWAIVKALGPAASLPLSPVEEP